LEVGFVGFPDDSFTTTAPASYIESIYILFRRRASANAVRCRRYRTRGAAGRPPPPGTGSGGALRPCMTSDIFQTSAPLPSMKHARPSAADASSARSSSLSCSTSNSSERPAGPAPAWERLVGNSHASSSDCLRPGGGAAATTSPPTSGGRGLSGRRRWWDAAAVCGWKQRAAAVCCCGGGGAPKAHARKRGLLEVRRHRGQQRR